MENNQHNLCPPIPIEKQPQDLPATIELFNNRATALEKAEKFTAKAEQYQQNSETIEYILEHGYVGIDGIFALVHLSFNRHQERRYRQKSQEEIERVVQLTGYQVNRQVN